MNYTEVKELISIINSSVLTNFELTMDNVSIKMSKNKDVAAAIQPAEVSAPIVPKAPAVQTVAQAPVAAPVMEEAVLHQPKVPEEQRGNVVKSPIVGTFYAAPGEGKAPFVKIGDKVQKGDILCIVEAMKIMNEIDSPYDGEIAEIYAENEQLVEYGQPLFRIQ